MTITSIPHPNDIHPNDIDPNHDDRTFTELDIRLLSASSEPRSATSIWAMTSTTTPLSRSEPCSCGTR